MSIVEVSHHLDHPLKISNSGLIHLTLFIYLLEVQPSPRTIEDLALDTPKEGWIDQL